ncbi:unnamed protein product, partial [Didymodactylos carnosus]
MSHPLENEDGNTNDSLSTPSPDVIILPEAQFIVEKIIGKRRRRGITEYFLKWQGYPESDNSWEPEGNIHPDLIEQFEKQDNTKQHIKPTVSSKKRKAKYDEQGNVSKKLVVTSDASNRTLITESHSSIYDDGQSQSQERRAPTTPTVSSSNEPGETT